MQTNPIRRASKLLALAAVASGMMILVLALAGPRLGFGIAEQFVFYRWFGLARSGLALGGSVIFVIGACATAFAYSADPRRLASNACIALGALLAALLFCEVVTRLIDGKPVFALRNWLAERNAMLTTQTANDFDPLLGWVLKAGQRAYPSDPANSFSTGIYGIRLNQPDAGQPPHGAILAVGDSFTAGAEVGDRHSWPAHLEQIMGRPVVNGATGGWSADQIILRAESLVPLLQPSMVIVSVHASSIEGAGLRVYSGANKPYFTVENDELVAHNRPVLLFSGRVGEVPSWLLLPSYSYFMQFAMRRLGAENWWQTYGVSMVKADNDPVAVTCALLDHLQRKLDEQRVGLLFVLQYSGGRTLAKPMNADAVVACAHRAGIPTLDLWNDLTQAHDRSFDDYARLWVSFDGVETFGHMSSAGNRFVAERIAATLHRIGGAD